MLGQIGRKSLRYLSILAAIITCGNAPVQALTFTPLGDLPGGSFGSIAYGVSANGGVVVGGSASSSSAASGTWPFVSEAFSWTLSTGMQPLGDLPGGAFNSVALDVSPSGGEIVGRSVTSGTGDQRGFLYTTLDGMVQIPDIVTNSAQAVTDGQQVVGGGASGAGGEAFRWDPVGGGQFLGHLPGATFPDSMSATDISFDGTVIVGWGRSSQGIQAFRWTASQGLVGLGDLPDGNFLSRAQAVSGDGLTVVGQGTSANGLEGFRWTESGGFEALGDLDGGAFSSIAWDTDFTGTIVVGRASTSEGDAAFMWDEQHGMRNLKSVLETDFDLDLEGWSLTSANAISGDGRHIVGSGINPSGQQEAWLATVPEPSSALLGMIAIGAVSLACLLRRGLRGRAKSLGL